MSAPLASCGEIFDEKYEIISILGAGGMGSVFKARQVGLERIVAIKILDQSLIADEDAVARFEREGKSISLLHHNHIAAFYSYGVFKGTPYIAMEYLQGRALNHVLNELPDGTGMEWKRAIAIARQVCEAMQCAHERGIIHRDLKPSNIVLEDNPEPDYVKVVDFGLAKFVEVTESGKQKLTQTGALIGSVDYLSPEQSKGLNADERSDIYSLACTLFQMLTGKLPFESDNPVGMIHKHAHERTPLITEVCAGKFPPGLEMVIGKAMEKSAEDRYPSMQDFEKDLARVAEGKGSELEIKLTQLPITKKKNSLIIPAALTLLLVPTGSLAYWYFETDAGRSLQIRGDLKGSNSTNKALFWLQQADKFDSQSKPISADLVRVEVRKAITDQTGNPYAAAHLYNMMAASCQAKGELKSAARWGLSCLQYFKDLGKPAESITDNNLREFNKEIETAASFALKNPTKYTKKQAVYLTEFAKSLSGFRATPKGNLAALAYKASSDSHLPPNRRLNEVLTFELELMNPAHKFTNEVLILAEPAIDTVSQTDGPNSERLARLYARLSYSLADSEYKAKSRQYLNYSLEVASKCDAHDNENLLESYKLATQAASKLGLHSKQEQIARKTIDMTCASTKDCWDCGCSTLILGKALYESKKYEQAFDTLDEGFRIIRGLEIVHDDGLRAKADQLCDFLIPLHDAAKATNQEKKGLAIFNQNLSYFRQVGPDGKIGASQTETLINSLGGVPNP